MTVTGVHVVRTVQLLELVFHALRRRPVSVKLILKIFSITFPVLDPDCIGLKEYECDINPQCLFCSSNELCLPWTDYKYLCPDICYGLPTDKCILNALCQSCPDGLCFPIGSTCPPELTTSEYEGGLIH